MLEITYINVSEFGEDRALTESVARKTAAWLEVRYPEFKGRIAVQFMQSGDTWDLWLTGRHDSTENESRARMSNSAYAYYQGMRSAMIDQGKIPG